MLLKITWPLAYIKENKKCPFWLKKTQSLSNLADWAVLPSEVRHESWVCPFHQKSTINSRINWQWLWGWISFYKLMTVATPCYWGLPHSPAVLVYCVLLPLSCSLFLTNDTRNTVFHGGSCGGTVIIWKEISRNIMYLFIHWVNVVGKNIYTSEFVPQYFWHATHCHGHFPIYWIYFFYFDLLFFISACNHIVLLVCLSSSLKYCWILNNF